MKKINKENNPLKFFNLKDTIAGTVRDAKNGTLEKNFIGAALAFGVPVLYFYFNGRVAEATYVSLATWLCYHQPQGLTPKARFIELLRYSVVLTLATFVGATTQGNVYLLAVAIFALTMLMRNHSLKIFAQVMVVIASIMPTPFTMWEKTGYFALGMAWNTILLMIPFFGGKYYSYRDKSDETPLKDLWSEIKTSTAHQFEYSKRTLTGRKSMSTHYLEQHDLLHPLRTSLTLVITLLVLHWLNAPHLMWIMMGVIVTLSSDFHKTKEAGMLRIMGIGIGTLIMVPIFIGGTHDITLPIILYVIAAVALGKALARYAPIYQMITSAPGLLAIIGMGTTLHTVDLLERVGWNVVGVIISLAAVLLFFPKQTGKYQNFLLRSNLIYHEKLHLSLLLKKPVSVDHYLHELQTSHESLQQSDISGAAIMESSLQLIAAAEQATEEDLDKSHHALARLNQKLNDESLHLSEVDEELKNHQRTMLEGVSPELANAQEIHVGNVVDALVEQQPL